jgi:hypothetical protein
MNEPLPQVYIFGWPSFLGGADTKLAHLLPLLHRDLAFTVVPNDPAHLADEHWTRFLADLGIRCCLREQLPSKLDGWALSLSNHRFFSDRIAHRAKDRGLKIVWSSEMMWHHDGELEAVKSGLVDKVLYVSEFQKRHLAGEYGDLPSAITGNYIDPAFFPFAERRHAVFAIGRLSRAAPEKYPEDFPVFYECLGLPDTRFRVMAWSDELARKYRWHTFDDRWDLLSAEQETQIAFLHSLDLFVYPLGHAFKESWGRSTVEAMLTGCVPLVPAGHHLDQLLVHGECGFICGDFLEYQEHAHRLFHDRPFRAAMARQCREHAVTKLCVAAEHRRAWLEVFR